MHRQGTEPLPYTVRSRPGISRNILVGPRNSLLLMVCIVRILTGDQSLTPLELTQKLITLTATNINLLVATIPGASTYDTPNANVPTRVANLLNWAQSGIGPGLQTVVDAAQTLFPSLFSPLPPVRPRKYLPYQRNVFFTGREDVLLRLHQALAQNKNAALTQAIAGLGGIGKTQTAIEYAYRHWDDYDAIFWCPADNEATLNTAYRDIATRLDLPQKGAQNPEDTNEAVKVWLAANSGYLLILDNADAPTIVKKYLPPHPSGHILVTSRAHNFAILNIKGPIRLNQLLAEDALTFLLQRTERETASETERIAATDLAHELGYLPLALEQAGAYIAHNEVPFAQYLADYRRLQIELLEKYGPVTGDYPETVRTTWNKSFAAIRTKSEAAAELLTISAFFSPNAIPYELIIRGAREIGEPLSSALLKSATDQTKIGECLIPLQELLTILAEYSLILRNVDSGTYDIHRMVQTVIQDKMDDSTKQAYTERAVLAINTTYTLVEFRYWPLYQRLLPHVLSIVEVIENKKIFLPEAARLLNQTAVYLRERAQYFQAARLMEQGLAIDEKVFGPEHANTALSLNNLAGIYLDLKSYKKVEPLLLRALKIRVNTAGPDHADTAHSLNGLAEFYRVQGMYDKAEPLFLQALAIYEKTPDTEPLKISFVLNNLALLYKLQGKLSKAEPLYIRSLRIREKELGNEHPDTAFILLNLGGLYLTQRNYLAAEPLMRRAISITQRTLGMAHPNTAHAFKGYAAILRGLGRVQEARDMEIHVENIMEAHRRLNSREGAVE